MNLALSIDSSGSMNGLPISLAKDVGETIAGNLRSGDILSIVTWNSNNRVLLNGHVVTGPGDETVMDAISSISSGGSTDLHGGLEKAYELVDDNFAEERTNRVLLISDGGANAGVTSTDLISAHAGAEGSDGIYMVGVGVGVTGGGYNDQLMDAVTDAGRGASVFIPDYDETERIFGERFVNTMEVAARDVQVNVEMPPGFEILRTSAEELSTDPAEVDPQNIAPNDSMVFHNTITTCAESWSEDDVFAITVHYKDPVTWETETVTLDTTMGELLAADPALLHKGTAVLTYADYMRSLRGEEGYPAPDVALDAVLDALDTAELHNPDDPDLEEIRAIIAAL